jgi:hypothetical protein
MTATIDGKAFTAATSFALQSDPVSSRYLLSGFSITLSPQPGTAARGQLTISGGTFDLGMYHTP